MQVVGIDIGFGDCKVVSGDSEGNIDKFYKFNSVLGEVDVSEYVQDKRVYNYCDKNYYIGELALSLESSKIIDITDYSRLEFYSPVLVKYIIDNLSEIPEVIVVGLSIAHVQNSGYYKEAIKKYLVEHHSLPVKEVYVIPQGFGGKLTIDKYGLNFPELSDKLSDNSNYLAADLGFNTIDIFQVVNNKTSGNLLKGIENEGITKIVNKLRELLKTKSSNDFGVKEVKDFLDKGSMKIRGRSVSLTPQINALKVEYIAELKALIEQKFGKILDKMDNMILFGGGAYLFNTIGDDFIKVPKSRSEYYNSIGQYLHGVNKLKEIAA